MATRRKPIFDTGVELDDFGLSEGLFEPPEIPESPPIAAPPPISVRDLLDEPAGRRQPARGLPPPEPMVGGAPPPPIAVRDLLGGPRPPEDLLDMPALRLPAPTAPDRMRPLRQDDREERPPEPEPLPQPQPPAQPAPAPPALTFDPRLEGFDPAKITSGDSPKYRIGRVLLGALNRGLPPTPETLRGLLPELRQLGLGDIQLVGDDKLSIPGIGIVDVIRAAGEGGKAFQWLQEAPGGSAPPAPLPSSGPLPAGAAGLAGLGLGGGDLDPFFFQLLGASAIAPTSGPLAGPATAAVQDLLERRGLLDPTRLALRLESARELVERARRGQLAQARAALAARGLLSEPGVPQGPEVSAIQRLEEQLAPVYAGAARDIALRELEAADERLVQAVQLALGASREQARSLLDTFRAGTERQQVLSNIALGILDRNLAFNTFLARFGLDRVQVLEALRQGRLELLLPILTAFLGSARQAAEGYI